MLKKPQATATNQGLSIPQYRKNDDGDELIVACPVCGELAFPYEGCWDACDNCGWFDDPLQRENPDEDGGENEMSLNQARAAYKAGLPIR